MTTQKAITLNTYSCSYPNRDYLSEIVGYWQAETQAYEWYDVFIEGECMNVDEPIYGTEYDAYMYMVQAGHDRYCEDNKEVN